MPAMLLKLEDSDARMIQAWRAELLGSAQYVSFQAKINAYKEMRSVPPTAQFSMDLCMFVLPEAPLQLPPAAAGEPVDEVTR